MSRAELTLFEHERLSLVRTGPTAYAIPEARGHGVLSLEQLVALDREAEKLTPRGASLGPVLRARASGRIEASGWVGVLSVGDVLVEVLPKIAWRRRRQDVGIARHRLLEMLSYSGFLPSMPELDASQTLERLSLYETVLGMFARSLDHALREGPWSTYVERLEHLHTVRGRLDFAEQVRRNLARPDRIACRHQPFVTDHLLNRILVFATHLATTATRVPATRRLLARCDDVLGDVPRDVVPLEACDRVRWSRLNERFRDAWRWAKLILGTHRPALRTGARPTFGLVFEMHAVFEAYISRIARAHLRARGWDVDDQPIIGHLVHDGDSQRIRQKPDLVMRPPDGPPIALDTKYKGYPGSRAAEADLRQVYAYQALLAPDAPTRQVVLLYPSGLGEPAECRVVQLLHPPGAATKVDLAIASVDIVSEGSAQWRRGRIAEGIERVLEGVRRGSVAR